jgi:hypothetical protein
LISNSKLTRFQRTAANRLSAFWLWCERTQSACCCYLHFLFTQSDGGLCLYRVIPIWLPGKVFICLLYRAGDNMRKGAGRCQPAGRQRSNAPAPLARRIVNFWRGSFPFSHFNIPSPKESCPPLALTTKGPQLKLPLTADALRRVFPTTNRVWEERRAVLCILRPRHIQTTTTTTKTATTQPPSANLTVCVFDPHRVGTFLLIESTDNG